MTLFKQMGLAILIIIATILSGVMIINYNSIKQEMVESLYETTVNNISTLADKLSDSEDNKAVVESIIDSEFDNGYFKKIEFIANDDSLNYLKIDNEEVEDVPRWFIDFSNIELKTVSVDVTSQWSILGVISVDGDTAIIYKSLYKLFLNLCYLFVASLMVSLIMISVMLYFILKPLYIIQHQAESILKHRFVINKKLPHTTEFKDVAIGMNMMVEKVEEIFQKGDEAVQRNKELLYNDNVTKLFNRRYLMIKLPQLIKIENKTDGGTIIFIALSGADILNQVLGHKKADDVFLDIATILKTTSKEFIDNIVARVNGTEFTIVLPDCDKEAGIKVVNSINNEFNKLIEEYNLNKIDIFINMGLYNYTSRVNVSELLTRADEALTKAKTDSKSNIAIYKEKNNKDDIGKEQWRKILEDAILTNSFRFEFNSTKNKIKSKVVTFNIENNNGKKYLYKDFIAPAIQLRLVSKIYILILKDLLKLKNKELNGCRCSVKLPNEFIKDSSSFNELSSIFKKYNNNLSFQLLFEVTDSLAIHNTASVKSFANLFYKFNFEFAINSFTGEANSFNYLKDLNLKFIKIESNFLLDQTEESINAIKIVTDSLDIELITTS